MDAGKGWAARNVLPTRFGRAAALAERNLISATGYAAGAPIRLVDGWTDNAIGRALHRRFDGGENKGAMQATADWLRLNACFAAGTKLMARGAWGEGYRCIEEITDRDEVLSRSELDARGPLEWKLVEETFTRFAEVVNLHTSGIIVRTTSEHPFWVVNRGAWVAAQDLGIGDGLVGHDGVEVVVEGVAPSGLWVPVYNLRVEDYHTYFVGDEAWGFSVWSHNMGEGCGPVKKGAPGSKTLSSDRLEQHARAYQAAIEANRPFKWSEIAPGIDKYQRRQVRQFAREQGYVKTAPVNDKGNANFDGHYYTHIDKNLDNVSLPNNLWNSHKETQFKYLNEQTFGMAKTPDGYTWHHHETSGRMQLVKYGIHLATDHVGGSEAGGWSHRR